MRANKVLRSPSLRTMMTRLCTCFFSLFIHCAFIPHFFRLLPCFCLAFALLYTTIEFTLTLTYTLLFCLNVDYAGMILSRVSLSQPSRSIDLSKICAIGFGAYVLPLICMLTCVSSPPPCVNYSIRSPSDDHTQKFRRAQSRKFRSSLQSTRRRKRGSRAR